MMRILIVDDDHEVADSLAFIVKRRGHLVTVVYDGESAVDLIADQGFDLAFLDLLLPGINGVECLLALRQRQPDLKAIMMTGFAGEDLIKAALTEGAIDVLRKPVMPEDILARLSRVGRKSLLIADDDDEYADTLATYLHRMGWTTKRASNGAEAVAMATTETFAAMLLDLKMPSLSGLEVLVTLKARGRLVPTIVITGNHDEGDVMSMADLQGYVRKPVDPRDLLLLIERATEHSAAA